MVNNSQVNNNQAANNGLKLAGGQKIWLLLALVGGGISLWMFLIVNKVWKENLKKEATIEELVVKANDVENLGIERQILNEQLNELSGFFLEGETGVARAAENMEQIASQIGVNLTFSFEDFESKVDIGGVYQTGLTMYMEVEGSYQGLVNFIKKVEELPYFIRLSEVKVGELKLTSGIKAEFKGVIFFKNE